MVEIPSRYRTQFNVWHEVDLLENRVNVCQGKCATQCYSTLTTRSILFIAGVEGILIGPGFGRKGGNARTGAEKGAMQYRQVSDVVVRAGRMQYTLYSDVANRAGSRWKVLDIPGGGACVLGR